MYKRISLNEFSNYLLENLTTDNATVEFAMYANAEEDDNEVEECDCEVWYFARRINIKEYESKFILLDYCGGEEAFAIPINNYKEGFDEDDKCLMPSYVKKFFEHASYTTTSVWVAIED